MNSKKYLGLFTIVCLIGIIIPLTPAFAHDGIFEYRKCLFQGQFWDMFCPSNPDNKKNPEVCLVYDKNCVFKPKNSLSQPPTKCIQMNPETNFCYESVKPAPPNCIWIDKDNEICTHYKP